VTPEPARPELSRVVPLDRVGSEPVTIDVVATEAECAALAQRFDWRALADLRGRVTLVAGAGGYAASGHVAATVVQACAVTDDDVTTTVAEPFDVRIVNPELAGAPADVAEVELGDDDLDVVELDGAAIDAGEIVAQTLALAVPLFARSPRAATYLAEQGITGAFAEGPLASLLRGAKRD
jgi:hypothetical protein